MDTRGTFSSTPLNCSLKGVTLPSGMCAIQLSRPGKVLMLGTSISPSTAEELASYQALATKYAQSCVELSTPAGILAHMATADTIQDWNSLRDALGYDTMDFLGVS